MKKYTIPWKIFENTEMKGEMKSCSRIRRLKIVKRSFIFKLLSSIAIQIKTLIEDFQYDKLILTFEWRKRAETSLYNYEREEQAGGGVTHQKSRWTKNCIT